MAVYPHGWIYTPTSLYSRPFYNLHISESHWEFYQKMLHAWYLTPHRLAKMYTLQPNLFWRKCEEIETLYHIVWSCKYIQSFWLQVFSLMSQLMYQIVPLNPALAILHLGIKEVPPAHRHLIIQLL